MNDREHREFGYRNDLRKAATAALKRRDQERRERELRDFAFLDFRDAAEQEAVDEVNRSMDHASSEIRNVSIGK